MTTSDAMDDEFDTWATWTADAAEQLGPDHALPAACRGSGSPAALDWLATSMGLRTGDRLLDAGAGVGGPAEFLSRHYGVVPTLVDPMPGAGAASARLFGRPGLVADGAALPLPDDAVEHAWSLGVLCTVEDKTAHLAELTRVVLPGGTVGLLVYLRTVPALPEQPDGNFFPSRPEMMSLLATARLDVEADAQLDAFPDAPTGWDDAVADVEAVIERRHADSPAWQHAHDQQQIMTRLLGEHLVAGHLWVCRVPQ